MSALLGVKHGTGRHRDDLDPHDFQQAMKWWWWCYLWLDASNWTLFTKLIVQ